MKLDEDLEKREPRGAAAAPGRLLAERAANAARAELRGERTGILGAIGSSAPPLLLSRTRRVPERWSLIHTNHLQGSISFASGANAGVTANVNSVTAGNALGLGYPLQSVPVPGDAFTVYDGCDHTPGTCQSKFNNLANFRGFPYVPPPQMAL